MAIKIDNPQMQDFILERSDELYGDGDPTRVTIRQATQSAHERRSQVFAEVSRVIERDDVYGAAQTSIRQKWSMEELKRVEVYLTLAGCTIEGPDGSPLFVFNNKNQLAMSESDFAKAWGMLPTDVAHEIHEKVLEVNYMWGNQGEGN